MPVTIGKFVDLKSDVANECTGRPVPHAVDGFFQNANGCCNCCCPNAEAVQGDSRVYNTGLLTSFLQDMGKRAANKGPGKCPHQNRKPAMALPGAMVRYDVNGWDVSQREFIGVELEFQKPGLQL